VSQPPSREVFEAYVASAVKAGLLAYGDRPGVVWETEAGRDFLIEAGKRYADVGAEVGRIMSGGLSEAEKTNALIVLLIDAWQRTGEQGFAD
jgi:hypothetical protein